MGVKIVFDLRSGGLKWSNFPFCLFLGGGRGEILYLISDLEVSDVVNLPFVQGGKNCI